MSEASSENKSLENLILVVDDDKVILKSFRRILEMEGYCVDTAESGEQSLEKVCSGHFHLALVGDRLPDMSHEDLEARISAFDTKVLGLGMKLIDPIDRVMRECASPFSRYISLDLSL